LTDLETLEIVEDTELPPRPIRKTVGPPYPYLDILSPEEIEELLWIDYQFQDQFNPPRSERS
jgi:hypothetical protein